MSTTVEELRDAIDNGVKETSFVFTHFEIVRVFDTRLEHIELTTVKDHARESSRLLGINGTFYPVYRGPGATLFPDDCKVLNYLKHGEFVGMRRPLHKLEGGYASTNVKRDWKR